MANTLRYLAVMAAGCLLTVMACARSSERASGWEWKAPLPRPDLDELHVTLGKCVSVNAYREWTLSFPKGAAPAKHAWKQRDGSRSGRLMDVRPIDEPQHQTWFACRQANPKGRQFV